MKTSRSVSDVVWKLTQNIRIYITLFSVLIGSIFAGITFHQTHRVACEVVESKLNALIGPLARELTLGELEVAQTIFEDIRRDLRNQGAKSSLQLIPSLGNNHSDEKSLVPVCSAEVFKSRVRFPLVFAGMTQAVIEGEVSYYSFWTFILFLSVVIACLSLLLRGISQTILKQVKLSLVEPILRLSRNQTVDSPANSMVLDEVSEIQRNLERLKAGVAEKERILLEVKQAEEIQALVEQVAHDIRSPLTALHLIIQKSTTLPETERLIVRSAAKRIKDISDQLLLRKGEKAPHPLASYEKRALSLSATFLFPVVEDVIGELKIQLEDRPELEVDFSYSEEAFALLTQIDSSEIQRILSNLLNNAADAIDRRGRIEVKLSSDSEHIRIVIKDNGKGIPPQILSQIGERGVSFAKQNGSGLGIYHARNYLAKVSGDLEIQSCEGLGTLVRLTLKKVVSPNWLCLGLDLKGCSDLAVIDDDPSIFQVWKSRIEKTTGLSKKPTLIYFASSTEFGEWIAARKRSEQDYSNMSFLVDLELRGESKTGLDLIEEFELHKRSILVTSKYEELWVQKRCEELGFQMIPKRMASIVPLVLNTPRKEGVNGDAGSISRTPNAVLLDDDTLVHLLWKKAAKESGKFLLAYQTAEEFLKGIEPLPRTVSLYLDVELGQDVRGDLLAQEAHKLGFTNIHLVTGHSERRFDSRWISSVLGKEPPFEVC